MKKGLKILLFIVLIIIVVVLVFVKVRGYKRVSDYSEGKIKIAVSIPETMEGEILEEINAVLAGLLLAQEEINEKRGILGKEIELIIEDDECEKEKGIESWNRIVNVHQPLVAIGPLCSLVAEEVLPLAQNAGIPTILSGAVAPDLTKAGDYIFNSYPSATFQSKFVADYIFTKLKKNKVAVFYTPKSPYIQMRDVFVERFNRFKELEAKVVFDEYVSDDEVDFKNQIEKIKESNADVLYILLQEYMRMEEIKKEKLDLIILTNELVEEKSDVAIYEGVLYPNLKIDISEDFKNRMSKVYKEDINFRTALYYDALNILVQAIVRAGVLDKEVIRDELEKTSYRGEAFPLVEFDDNREIKQAEFEMKIIKNGQKEIFIID